VRLLHGLARTHASFDDPDLVSRAGPVPVMALAQCAGQLLGCLARLSRPQASSALNRSRSGRVAGLACSSISHMTELTDVSGAFGYGDSILVGERVRLRGVRDDDLPALARWEMDPGRLITLSNWVAPPSEAAAKERIAKRSANEKDDLGLPSRRSTTRRYWSAASGCPLRARAPRTGGRRSGSRTRIRGEASAADSPPARPALSARCRSSASPGRRGPGAHQPGRAPPVPAAVRLSRAPRWPHGPPGRDGRWPAGSAIRNLPRNIRPSRNIWAIGVAQSFRGSRMFHANGGGGTGVWDGIASACPYAPAAPDRLAGRPPGLRDTTYGTRSGWPHRHRPRPFSLSKCR
jgi:hypothetical protein